MIVMDPKNKPLPYVSHRLPSSRRNSNESTLAPPISNEIADWIKNASLFALGVFLIEVAYHRSIEDLAVKKEKEAAPALTTLLTAHRMSKIVHEELGSSYAQAVEACLHPQHFDLDDEGKPKDSSQFARYVIRNIIDPLKAVEDWLEKKQTAAVEAS